MTIYALSPRLTRPPRPLLPRLHSIAIASKYAVFLPSRRDLPSSLAGAVLTGISVDSNGVEAAGDTSRVIVIEGVVGVAGAARGFSGVRSTSVNDLFLVFSSVVDLADESIG